jgi:flagellar basal-body rod protein FlgB
VARRLLDGECVKTLFDTVGELSRTMSFHRDRHAVLAGNLANQDTPGYTPLDLAPATTEAPLAELTRTDARHLPPSEIETAPEVFDDPDAEPGPDGNAVSLEREMAKIDANRVRYGTASELASRRLALLRYASTDGNG